MYMAIAREKHAAEEHKQELEWLRTRALWVPIMNANFSKNGGGKYEPADLITLKLDKTNKVTSEPANLETFEKMVAKHGKRRKKNGNK